MIGASTRSLSPVCGEEPGERHLRVDAHNRAVRLAGACSRCGSTEPISRGEAAMTVATPCPYRCDHRAGYFAFTPPLTCAFRRGGPHA